MPSNLCGACNQRVAIGVQCTICDFWFHCGEKRLCVDRRDGYTPFVCKSCLTALKAETETGIEQERREVEREEARLVSPQRQTSTKEDIAFAMDQRRATLMTDEWRDRALMEGWSLDEHRSYVAAGGASGAAASREPFLSGSDKEGVKPLGRVGSLSTVEGEGWHLYHPKSTFKSTAENELVDDLASENSDSMSGQLAGSIQSFYQSPAYVLAKLEGFQERLERGRLKTRDVVQIRAKMFFPQGRRRMTALESFRFGTSQAEVRLPEALGASVIGGSVALGNSRMLDRSGRSPSPGSPLGMSMISRKAMGHTIRRNSSFHEKLIQEDAADEKGFSHNRKRYTLALNDAEEVESDYDSEAEAMSDISDSEADIIMTPRGSRVKVPKRMMCVTPHEGSGNGMSVTLGEMSDSVKDAMAGVYDRRGKQKRPPGGKPLVSTVETVVTSTEMRDLLLKRERKRAEDEARRMRFAELARDRMKLHEGNEFKLREGTAFYDEHKAADRTRILLAEDRILAGGLAAVAEEDVSSVDSEVDERDLESKYRHLNRDEREERRRLRAVQKEATERSNVKGTSYVGNMGMRQRNAVTTAEHTSKDHHGGHTDPFMLGNLADRGDMLSTAHRKMYFRNLPPTMHPSGHPYGSPRGDSTGDASVSGSRKRRGSGGKGRAAPFDGVAIQIGGGASAMRVSAVEELTDDER